MKQQLNLLPNILVSQICPPYLFELFTYLLYTDSCAKSYIYEYIRKIKYIIGINTGANIAVVSAYEVSFEQAESIETNNGRMRYAFIGLSERDTTLNNLNLYKKALPNLKFGSGSATAYINSYN